MAAQGEQIGPTGSAPDAPADGIKTDARTSTGTAPGTGTHTGTAPRTTAQARVHPRTSAVRSVHAPIVPGACTLATPLRKWGA
ncbi:hypothetical protein GCM10010220_22870 [Streptomyces parvulus]|nr:hypothetical protein GCM10010220_22870 [Streptomyces parvulus]